MFELTKEFLSIVKNSIFSEEQLVYSGHNVQYACPTCRGTCGGTCQGGCSRSSRGGR